MVWSLILRFWRKSEGRDCVLHFWDYSHDMEVRIQSFLGMFQTSISLSSSNWSQLQGLRLLKWGACEKGDQWLLALTFFDAMQTGRHSADVISYNAAISACAKGAQWITAVAFFHAMSNSKIDPTIISYNACISACEKGGQWHHAIAWFDTLSKASHCDVISYSAAISACEKCGHWQHALFFFEAMPKVRVFPNLLSYSAAISACETLGLEP